MIILFIIPQYGGFMAHDLQDIDGLLVFIKNVIMHVCIYLVYNVEATCMNRKHHFPCEKHSLATIYIYCFIAQNNVSHT